jgi:hypothetical protein
MSIVLEKKKIDHVVQRGKAWSYITFPLTSGYNHLFLIEYHLEFEEKDDVYKHRNGFDRIREVYVEGGEPVVEFLSSLGMPLNDHFINKETGNVPALKAKAGNIIVKEGGGNSRPGVQSVVFGNNYNEKILRIWL